MKFIHPYKGPSQKLKELTSFVKADDVDAAILTRDVLSANEILIGIYFNSADDFVVFTTQAIHWLSDPVHRQIRYRSIKEICPHFGERTIDLYLDDGECLPLPVINETDDVLDIDLIFDFLAAVVYWPLGTDNLERIAAIDSADTLAKFLADDEDLADTYMQTVLALRSGFPSLWQLQRLGITPDVMNQPQTWRLLALFLSIRQIRYDYP